MKHLPEIHLLKPQSTCNLHQGFELAAYIASILELALTHSSLGVMVLNEGVTGPYQLPC